MITLVFFQFLLEFGADIIVITATRTWRMIRWVVNTTDSILGLSYAEDSFLWTMYVVLLLVFLLGNDLVNASFGFPLSFLDSVLD